MKAKQILNTRPALKLLIILLILAMFYPSFNIPPRAHAATNGTVCLVDPGITATTPTTNVCPSTTTQSFTGPNATSAGLQLRVAVNINASSPINGFDISLKTDHTIIQPFDADLTNSVLNAIGGSIQVAVKCIGGVRVQGAQCTSTDTVDTLRLVATVQGGTGVTSNNGLLFTAVYNIVGNVTSGSTPIAFQTGCGTVPNPTSNPPNCITIENGSIQAVPENILTATYSTSKTSVPFFNLSASRTSLTLIRGVAGSQTSIISLHENNSFTCGGPGGLNCVDLSAFGSNSTGPTASVAPAAVTDGGTATLTVTATKFVPVGIYSFYVVSFPDTTNTPTTGTTYVGSFLSITVHVSDFAITANVTTLTVFPSSSGAAKITLTSLNTFSGTVSLTASSSPSGPTTSLSPTSLKVSTGGTNSSTLTITMPPTTQTVPFILTITGTIQTLSHTVKISLSPGIPILTITLVTSTGSASIGQTVKITVTVQNTGPASGNFLLAAKWGNITVGGPTNVTLAAGASQTFIYNWTTTGFTAASLNLTAVATGGNLPSSSSSSPTTVALTAPPPSPFSDNLLLIIAGIIAAIVIIAVALLLRRRRGQTRVTP